MKPTAARTWRRDLLVTLVERQWRLRTKRSVLGIAWPILGPFLLLALYVFVFQRVFNVPIARYPEFLLCGLLPWAFLAQTLGRAISSISAEQDMVRKLGSRYELLPLSVVTAEAVNLLIGLAGFVIYLAVRGRLPLDTFPALVFPVAATILLVMSLAMLVALIDVYSHDLRLVLGNLLTVWFFLVPIVYRPAMQPRQLRFLQSVDPMNLITGQMRGVLYAGRIDRPDHMVLMVVVCSALFAVALWIFRRCSVDLAKDV